MDKKNQTGSNPLKGEANNAKPNNKNWKNNAKHNGGRRYDSQNKGVKDKTPDASFKTNDPTWYAKTPQLLKDSASLSFNNAVGAKIDYNMPAVVPGLLTNLPESFPGVACLKMVTIPGVSDSASAPINVAARNIYSYVRHANSGHANYDSPDLMLYLLAMDQLYSMYSWMCRSYGIMGAYSQKNRYMASGLITALDFDYNDFLANLADYRYFINQFGLKISALYTPATMDLYKRHTYIYSGVWADADSEKSQLYVTKPAGFHKFSPTASVYGGSLQFEVVPGDVNTPMTFAALKTYANSFLDAVLTDEDMNIMSGDIKKAYADKLYSLSLIPENYVITPTYDEVFLSQIQNAVLCDRVNANTMHVTQNAGSEYLMFNPQFENDVWDLLSRATASPVTANRVLTIRKENVEPADVMEATRLMCSRKLTQDGHNVIINSSAAEIVLNLSIWKFIVSGGVWKFKPITTSFCSEIFVTVEVPSFVEYIRDLCDLEKFDWHPSVRMFIPNSDGRPQDWDYATDFIFLGDQMDVDNYTIIGDREISKLNETALLSLFGVPQP